RDEHGERRQPAQQPARLLADRRHRDLLRFGLRSSAGVVTIALLFGGLLLLFEALERQPALAEDQPAHGQTIYRGYQQQYSQRRDDVPAQRHHGDEVAIEHQAGHQHESAAHGDAYRLAHAQRLGEHSATDRPDPAGGEQAPSQYGQPDRREREQQPPDRVDRRGRTAQQQQTQHEQRRQYAHGKPRRGGAQCLASQSWPAKMRLGEAVFDHHYAQAGHGIRRHDE